MYDKLAEAYLSMLQSDYIQLSEETTLMENTNQVNFLIKRYPEVNTSHDTYALHKSAKDIIQHFSDNADPTKQKKYLPWIVKAYHNGTFRQEDTPRVLDTLKDWDAHKDKLPSNAKDINQYKRLSDIADAVSQFSHVPAVRSERTDFLRNHPTKHFPGKHELIHEDAYAKYYHVKNKEMSQFMYNEHEGAFPTKWCTAWADDSNRTCMFPDYDKDENLIAMHRKKDGAVFQIGAVSNQIKDKNDDEVDSATFKDMEDSLAGLVSKHHELVLQDKKNMK